LPTGRAIRWYNAINITARGAARPQNAFALPGYVNDLIFSFGWASAYQRVQTQLANADNSEAARFFSQVLAGMNGMNGATVPSVVPFNAAAISDLWNRT
jgi:hypothetical protein